MRANSHIGGDLLRAIRDAPQKDPGFSPLTLAWVLRQMPIQMPCQTSGLPPQEAERLIAFRDVLIEQIVAAVP